MSTEQMPLDEWLGRLAKLAGYENGAELIADTGAECWRDYYEDGYSPESAWAEECSYD